MGGIIDGLKWGIILNLGAVVVLPVLTRFLGTQPGSGGAPAHRPFGGYGFYCMEEDGYCGGGGGGDQGGYEGGGGGGGHKKKHKKGGHGGGHGGGMGYYW